ncbi:M4 family metallopeptidase [Nocardioides bizhenqiangii]|uniref:M4 family metallopeptidase n=1 Tax=Nocardioides bizhenqiangii TaxID=3095076 RepID=A0ABZ0ZW06_9ACTN|nr:M4 family metallopeptidase [Nocardioides sp. HM61]WQQ28490.1 M4 family metallopeptidase [Nocardioides sp. HM61]
MKNFNRGRSFAVGLALVAAGLAAPPAVSASAAPTTQPDPSLVAEMRDEASGKLALRNNPATGKVGFARANGADPDLLPGVAAEGRAGAIDKATRYLDRFAGAFGARASELKQTEVYSDRGGHSVTFTQSYKGIPVFAAELKAEVNREGALTSVNGFAAPGLSLSTSPRFSESQASARALELVKASPEGHEDGGVPEGFTKGLEVRSIKLMIYRTGTPRGIDGVNRLAWVAEVWNKSTIRETVILDAETNKPLNRWSMMAHALDRELFEGNEDGTYTHVWSEGDPFPAGLTEDQENEILGAGESYWMFRNTFGYNSWDGTGGTMYTTNNDPRISCPNANWNGFSTNYCTGVTGDDTVAHEWAHAYTESTSGLIYQWQSGAMNEAYSDIWGETVDMLNTRHNEGGDTQADKIERTEGVCSVHTRSAVTMEITAPASVDGPCTAAPASFGPVITQAGVSGTAIVGVDGVGTLPDGTPDSSTGNGCLPFTNAGDIAGQWVYVDRGSCTFQTKADNADAAGAEGIVVGDNVAGRDPISMSGISDIYGVMVTLEDGERFKTAGGPVSFDIAAVPAPTDDTYRWLSGEADPAFGGAIRDMWNPNCYGHPGAVSDAEYHCDESDSGGVHSNSGVVNRTFAILVDGLDGKVAPIGLDKAAWLFWYSQIHYLTPSSYFPDLADALEASCAALQGVTFEKVTLGNPSDPDGSDGGVVDPELVEGGTTATDCNRVKDAIAETELRLDPQEQCDWQPLLQPGNPSVCGDKFLTKTTYVEKFEDGLAGWSQDEELGFAFSEGIPWEVAEENDGPAGQGSNAAFAPDPVTGTCGAPGDLTSRNGLISPDIQVPRGRVPRLTFRHYMASEATWDGGNVKVSVNGGAFELVPADAYLFNAPGRELDPTQGTSMGGELAWTGTDGGQLTGSWGKSIINLRGLADAGDTVNFRFDFGRDGCNGVDGWYVDNVKVQVCAPKPVGTDTKVVDVDPRPVVKGKAFTVKVKVTANNGKTPTGRVALFVGAAKLGRDTLNGNGVAEITVLRIFRVGSHDLLARYNGSELFRPSRQGFTIRVVRP